MADPVTIFVALAAPSAVLIGAIGALFGSMFREQRQAQEAKRKFGVDVRALFQERVEALESARGREHVQHRKDTLRARLAAVEDEYFGFLDDMLLRDPDVSSYIRARGQLLDQLVTAKELLQGDVEDLQRREGIDPTGQVAADKRELPADVKENLSDRLSLLKEMKAAEQRFEVVEPLPPEAIADEHLSQGNAYWAAGQFQNALTEYDRALEMRPDDAIILMNRGVSLDDLGRHEEAFAAYNRSLELRPDHPDTLMNRGITLRHLERYEDALADFNRALELRPDHSYTVYNRAWLYALWKKPDEAFNDLQRVIASDPDFLVLARIDPALTNIRSDPRFRELVGEDEPPSGDRTGS